MPMADRGVRPTWKATPFGHITQEQCDAFEARMNATAATVQDDDTPLIVAVRQGRAADVAALLADGADVNQADERGRTRVKCRQLPNRDTTHARPLFLQ